MLRSVTNSSELIADVYAIDDSRGRPTVRCTLRLGDMEGSGDVPAGASKGEDEAATVPVSQAIDNINQIILPALREAGLDLMTHEYVERLDRLIAEKSGPNFRTLGANAALPVSRALWQLAAALHGQQLALYMRANSEAGNEGHVLFMMNIFNGGLHALKEGECLGQDRIDIQEIMVVPMTASTYEQALAMGDRIDGHLKKILEKKFGADKVTRADEAGFSVRGLGDSKAAFALVFDAINKAGYTPGHDVKLALDVAASSFYDANTGFYRVQGQTLSTEDMIAYLVGLVDAYPGMLLSVEDGLAENDWEGWPVLTEEMSKRKVTTIGDDLFVTQFPRLLRGIETKAATGILIKVNQNGTVQGTLDVMKHAHDAGMKCIVSHRSGETLDDSIADLAFGTGAFGLKTGDPQPVGDFTDPDAWVRRVKYLRMIALEQD